MFINIGVLRLHSTDWKSSLTETCIIFLKFVFDCVLFIQYALSDHLNDGRQNLLGAIMIAGHYVIPEVNTFCSILKN